jgi:putative tryptophan/tyrosine transport system substrate-binding protein
MAIHIRRREFIVTLCGATAWSLATHAQQRAMPMIGYLDTASASTTAAHLVAAFHEGLGATGYEEGRNIVIEYRWPMEIMTSCLVWLPIWFDATSR